MKGRLIGAALMVVASLGTARAEELKLAVGQRGAWETSVAEFGQRKGFFKEQDLDLALVYTQGGGETLQAVLSGSVDIGVGLGTVGVIGAAAKGAPVRIISANYTGSPDLFWYARTDSNIKSFEDAEGKTVAYGSTGSSTQIVALKLLEMAGVNATPVATGAVPATATSVMSKQIDIGWAFPPYVFDRIRSGEVQIVGRGSDVQELANQTVRVLASTASIVERKRDALARFMTAYQKTIDWMYQDSEAIKWYAELNNATIEDAERAVEQFHPREALRLGEVRALDVSMNQAIEFKFINQPLTDDQVQTMMSIITPQ